MQDKMREEFEAWYIADFKERTGWGLTIERLSVWREGDGYGECAYLNGCWVGWQAAKAAAVVELPDRREGKYCDLTGFDDVKFSDDCRKAIEAAGVKVADPAKVSDRCECGSRRKDQCAPGGKMCLKDIK